MSAGIYLIRNKINDKKYIGQSTNIENRWSHHKSRSISNHYSLVHRAIKKYGIDNFEFVVLEYHDSYSKNLTKILNEREKYWISKLDTIVDHGKGYNLTYGGDSRGNLSELTKTRISDALKKVPRTKEWSKNIGLSRKGVPNQKASITQKGISVPSRGKKGKRVTSFNKRIKAVNKITGEIIIFERQSDCSIYLYGKNYSSRIKQLLNGFTPRYVGKTWDIYKTWNLEIIN
jgi:group I intron endonuclease